ncbi:MAG: protein-disulfide reductase DsbD domain-containing protein [Pseudomonadota bacterium]
MKSALGSLLLLLTATTAGHGASSAWFETEGAKIRLVGLPSPDGKTIDAGLQIELERGWKTYWKSPGASGLPPQLSFAGSQNVIKATLGFPAPKAFKDGDSLSAGYSGSVTLPIAVEPLYSNRSVALKAQGLVGICSEICVPVQFVLSMDVGPQSQSRRDEAAALFAAKSNMPGRAHEGFAISTATLAKPRLLRVTAAVPDGTEAAELFITAPAGWYLTPSSATKVENAKAHFLVPLTDIPSKAQVNGVALTMTLVADGDAVEQTVTVNAP